MHVRPWRARLLTAVACGALVCPAAAATAQAAPHFAFSQQAQRGYQEPAYARGYADGYARGLDHGRRRERYDPVGSAEYRDADRGYDRSYGSRDAYRNNYRAGFRQGYEDGYRAGTR